MDLNLAAVVFMGGYILVIIAAGLFITLRPAGTVVHLQSPPSRVSESSGGRDEILLGGEAEASGIPRGRVHAVVVEPRTLEIQALALSAGLGLLEDRLIPAAAMAAADGHAVHLSGWNEDLDGPPADAVTLRQDAAVLSAEGKRLGQLRVVCFDRASRTVTSLAVAGRRSSPGARLVPIGLVKGVDRTRITTGVKAADWPTLKPYASDWTIAQTILERWAADGTVKPFLPALGVDVRDQQARLRGYVTTRVQADRALQLAQSVPGVLGVDQGIVSDEDLIAAVSQALRKDPRTASADVHVRSRRGRLEITGHAPDPAAVAAIDGVALQVPGALVVHNLTTVR